MSTEFVLVGAWSLAMFLGLGWLLHQVDRLEVKLAELDVRLGILEDTQAER